MISVSTVLPKLDQRTLLDLLSQLLSLTAQSQGTMLGELFFVWSERGGVEWRFGSMLERTHPILFITLIPDPPRPNTFLIASNPFTQPHPQIEGLY